MILQQIINGITLGAVYALIALGYTMVYGVLELINFAHGDIYMVGAYLGLLFLSFFNVSGVTGPALIPTTMIVFLFPMVLCGLLGMGIEKVAYKPLRNAPRLAPLITSLGVSIVLQNAVMLIAGSENKPFNFFPFINNVVQVGDASVSFIKIFIIAVSVILMAGLSLFINNTRTGKAMRAVAQDKKTAALMGINVDRIISLTFLIGSSLAAAAGVMVAAYYGVINFTMGYLAGLKAFTAAVLGGIGNIPGAMLGGLLIGLVESLGAGIISSEYKDVFAFVILIVVLILKPSGLLKKRADA